MRYTIFNGTTDISLGPISNKITIAFGSSDKRVAITAPAEPPPTTTKSTDNVDETIITCECKGKLG